MCLLNMKKKNNNIFLQIKNNKLPKILVLNGGGIKGLAHIGALEYLEEHKYLSEIHTIACTSVGSIIGLGLVLGYTAQEMHLIAEKLRIDHLHSCNYHDLFTKYGLDLGEKIDFLLKKIIAKKTKKALVTLKELYEWKKIKLNITTSELGEGKVIYLNHETFPDLPVYLAIRMSCAIPFIFCPVKYKDKYYIDGGCSDDYPIMLYQDQLSEVLGIHLKNQYQTEVKTFEDVVIGCMYCILNASNKEAELFKNNTIEIEISKLSINLNISPEMKKELFQKGYECAKKRFE
jgi:NTE family protein